MEHLSEQDPPAALGCELIILVGLQASGKSTFYRAHFASTHVLVSKDLLRNSHRPALRQVQLIEQALAAGRSVVVDNTNPTVADRADLIALGRHFGSRVIGYYFASEMLHCLTRNESRTGRARVPDVALYATMGRLVRPSYAEGFDSLFFVRLAGEGAFVMEPWADELTEP